MMRDAQNEKYTIDCITHGLLSASLLGQFTAEVYSDRRDEMTIGEFYDRFNATHQSQRFRPFNGGVLLAYMYLLLFARENWPDLVPDFDLSSWNISPVRLLIAKHPRPKLKYLIRRLRNALAHGTPTINVPPGTTPATMGTAITLTFKDTDPKDSSDTFEAELTMQDAFHIVKMLHRIVVEDAANRYGVIPPLTKVL